MEKNISKTLCKTIAPDFSGPVTCVCQTIAFWHRSCISKNHATLLGTILAYGHVGIGLAVARIMPGCLAQFLHTSTLAQFLQLQESCQTSWHRSCIRTHWHGSCSCKNHARLLCKTIAPACTQTCWHSSCFRKNHARLLCQTNAPVPFGTGAGGAGRLRLPNGSPCLARSGCGCSRLRAFA